MLVRLLKDLPTASVGEKIYAAQRLNGDWILMGDHPDGIPSEWAVLVPKNKMNEWIEYAPDPSETTSTT